MITWIPRQRNHLSSTRLAFWFFYNNFPSIFFVRVFISITLKLAHFAHCSDSGIFQGRTIRNCQDMSQWTAGRQEMIGEPCYINPRFCHCDQVWIFILVCVCQRGKICSTNRGGAGEIQVGSCVECGVCWPGVLVVVAVVVSKDFRRATLGSRGQCGSVHDIGSRVLPIS